MATNNDTIVETEEEKATRIRKSLTTRGLSGCNNIGNTCYMNSVLQCLSAVGMLCVYLREDQYMTNLKENIVRDLAKNVKPGNDGNIMIDSKEIDKKMNDSITISLAKTLRALWLKNCTVSPQSLKRVIGLNDEQFNGFLQNDAHELMCMILHKIHEETRIKTKAVIKQITQNQMYLINLTTQMTSLLSDEANEISASHKGQQIDAYYKIINANMDDWAIVKSYIQKQFYYENEGRSIVSDLFTGLFLSEIKCSECSNVSLAFETFNIFTVEIPEKGDSTLDQCLEQFSKEELLQGDNKYSCSRCKKRTDAVKRMYVWESPKILIVQLKRFKMNNHGQATKNNSVITFPINNFSLEKVYSGRNKSKQRTYNLLSVSDHSGNCHGGHYVAVSRSAMNNRWYKYDDKQVFHVDQEKLASELHTTNAYILVYEGV